MNLRKLLLIVTTIFVTQLMANDFSDINKDMRIMKRILEASLKGDNRFGTRVEAQYLANQGMVFTVHTSRFSIPGSDIEWESWGEAMGMNALSMVQDSIPAMASVLPPEAVAEMEREIESGMMELQEGSHGESGALREQLAMMRETIREQKESYRDTLRELRRVEREEISANEAERAKLEEKRKALASRLEKSKKEMEKYNKKMEEYREARLQKYQQKKNVTIDEAVLALCEYNASLKSLSNKEHVTLIFDNFARNKGKRNEIYVFTKSDLEDCDSDSDGIQALKQTAIVYQQ